MLRLRWQMQVANMRKIVAGCEEITVCDGVYVYARIDRKRGRQNRKDDQTWIDVKRMAGAKRQLPRLVNEHISYRTVPCYGEEDEGRGVCSSDVGC